MSQDYRILIASSDAENFRQLREKKVPAQFVFEESLHEIHKKINKQHFDLVVLSSKIKGVSTLDFLAELRKTHFLIPVLIVFHTMDGKEAVDFTNLKISYFLQLPADPDEIMYRITDCLSYRDVSGFNVNWQMMNELSVYIPGDEISMNDLSESCDRLANIFYPNENSFLSKFKSAIYEALECASKYGCRSDSDKLFVKISFYGDHVQVRIRDPGSGFNYSAEHENQKALIESGADVGGNYGLGMIEYLSDDFQFSVSGNSLNFLMLINPDVPAVN